MRPLSNTISACVLVVVVLALLINWESISVVQAQTTTTVPINTVQYWLGTWQVNLTAGAPTCQLAHCCCFNNIVNGFLDSRGELNYNGTVDGQCDGPVKEDNLDPPTRTGYTTTQEFFGIDSYMFTLTNASDGSAIVLTALTTPTAPNCSFQLFEPVASPNQLLPTLPMTIITDPNFNPCMGPATPCENNGVCNIVPATAALPATYTCTCTIGFSGTTCQTVVPITAQVFNGTWQVDNTCRADNNDCCCFVSTVDIYPDPSGVPSLFVSGTASSGCNVLNVHGSLQDDIPWPVTGSSVNTNVTVEGFLPNQDNYFVQLTNTTGQASITFTDLTNSLCSIRVYRPLANTIGSSGGTSSTANHTTIIVVPPGNGATSTLSPSLSFLFCTIVLCFLSFI